jgi:hypothetical protein
MFGTPGLTLFAYPSADVGCVRATYVVNDILYAVVNNTVYSITLLGAVTSLGTISTSAGFVSMVSRGIYPTLGYTYAHQLNAGIRNTSFPLAQSHMVDASILINKRLVKLMNKRINGICHYVSLGLILAPEYHYMFGTREHPNESFGEVGGQIGLSLYHHYSSESKRARSKTRQYDLFYRQGFTPIFAETINGSEQKYFRQELGIRVRLIHHAVYDFLK